MKTYSFLMTLYEDKMGHLGEVVGYDNKKDYEEDWEIYCGIVTQNSPNMIAIIDKIATDLKYPDKFMALLLCKSVITSANGIIDFLNKEMADGN